MAISNVQEELLFDDLCFTFHETLSIERRYLHLCDVSSLIDRFFHHDHKLLVYIKFPSWSEIFVCVDVSVATTHEYNPLPRRRIMF